MQNSTRFFDKFDFDNVICKAVTNSVTKIRALIRDAEITRLASLALKDVGISPICISTIAVYTDRNAQIFPSLQMHLSSFRVKNC